MANFKPKFGIKSKVIQHRIQNGSFQVTLDTGQLFVDLNNQRKQINSLNAPNNIVNTLKKSFAALGIIIIDKNAVLSLQNDKIILDENSNQVINNTLILGENN